MDLHDNALQFNLCMKERELESLLLKDPAAGATASAVAVHKRPSQTPSAQSNGSGGVGGNYQQINYLNYQYQIFAEGSQRPPMRSAYANKSFNTKRDATTSTKNAEINLPYPEDDEVNLRKLLKSQFVIRTKEPTGFVKLMRKLNSVSFYLKESAKQREHLLFTLQRNDTQGLNCTRMDKVEYKQPSCCTEHKSTVEDFQLIIQKVTDCIQSATMESNLYRGMILLIANNCDTFDSYSSMTARMMMKELEECIDDVTVLLKDFMRDRLTITAFEEFRKHNELLAGVDTLITCIRCCTSFTWVIETRYGMASGSDSRKKQVLTPTPEKWSRDTNIGSI